jgi:hypothetical protein
VACCAPLDVWIDPTKTRPLHAQPDCSSQSTARMFGYTHSLVLNHRELTLSVLLFGCLHRGEAGCMSGCKTSHFIVIWLHPLVRKKIVVSSQPGLPEPARLDTVIQSGEACNRPACSRSYPPKYNFAQQPETEQSLQRSGGASFKSKARSRGTPPLRYRPLPVGAGAPVRFPHDGVFQSPKAAALRCGSQCRGKAEDVGGRDHASLALKPIEERRSRSPGTCPGSPGCGSAIALAGILVYLINSQRKYDFFLRNPSLKIYFH